MTKRFLLLTLVALLTTAGMAQRAAKVAVRQGAPDRQKTVRRAAPTNFIADQPEGEVKQYVHSGMSMTAFGSYIYHGQQDEVVTHVVYAPDGKTVYMDHPVSGISCNGWVKGELSADGKELHMPAGQMIFYEEYEPNDYYPDGDIVGYQMWMMEYYETEEYYTYVTTDDDIVWTVDDAAGTIALASTADGQQVILSVTQYSPYDEYNDGLWVGGGEYATVLSRIEVGTVAPPAGTAAQDYSLRYGYDDWNGTRIVGNFVSVAKDGQDVYIRGLSSDYPDAWVKGTLDADNRLTIPRTFLGFDEESARAVYLSLLLPADYEADRYSDEAVVGDVVLSYDPATQTFTAVTPFCLAKSYAWIVSSFANAVLAPFKEVAAVPMTPQIFSFDTTPGWQMEEEEGQEHTHPVSYCADIYVAPLDVDGNFLNPNKLYYQYYSGDENHPYTFLRSNYSYTEEVDGYDYEPEWTADFTEIPYTFTDDAQDFQFWRTYLRYGEIKRLGLQSIYRGGGEEHRSPICWFGEDTAVKTMNRVGSLLSDDSIYDMQGRRLSAPVRGLNIVKRADGTTQKVMVK